IWGDLALAAMRPILTDKIVRADKNLIRASASAILWCVEGHLRIGNTTIRLHRLAARVRVRGDVRSALLQLVVGWRRAAGIVLWVIAIQRNSSRTAVCIPGGPFVGAGDGPDATQRRPGRSNRHADDSPRRGNFWTCSSVSLAGIFAGLSEGAMDGFAARGRTEHDWALDRVDGHPVLVHAEPGGECIRGCGCRAGNFTRHAAPLDDVAPAVAAVVSRVVLRRRAHLRNTAAVAISSFSVVGICVRGARGRI